MRLVITGILTLIIIVMVCAFKDDPTLSKDNFYPKEISNSQEKISFYEKNRKFLSLWETYHYTIDIPFRYDR